MSWFIHTVRYFRKPLTVFLTPVLFSPIPILYGSPEAKCGYLIIVMLIFWITEALPVAITSLMPIFALPFLGILSTSDVCQTYLQEANILFLGALIVAIAVEYCRLDRRIALFIIIRVGQSPGQLVAGLMVVTMLLSMWTNSVIVVAFMIPIAEAVVEEHKKEEKLITIRNGFVIPTITITSVEEEKENGIQNPGFQEVPDDLKSHIDGPVSEGGYAVMTDVTEDLEAESTEADNFKKVVFFAIAAAANIGGTGILTGAPSNLVLTAVLRSSFSDDTQLNYASWLAFNIPCVILSIFLSWLWLQFICFGINFHRIFSKKTNWASAERRNVMKQFLETEYRDLGAVSLHEAHVLVSLLVLITLWFFRDPIVIPGWANYFTTSYHNNSLQILDATPAMLIIAILFALPSKLPSDLDPARGSSDEQCSGCLSWQFVAERVPWNLILFLGGCFALAEASIKSNLAGLVGEYLGVLRVLPPSLILIIFTAIAILVSNVTSSTAAVAIIAPFLTELSLRLCVNPLYFLLPVTVSCSYSFTLPLAIPTIFAALNGDSLKIWDVIKVSCGMSVICLIVVNVMMNTLGIAVFNLKTLPLWINSTTNYLPTC